MLTHPENSPPVDGSGASVIAILGQNWRRFELLLSKYLMQRYGNIHHHHDQIIGDAATAALEKSGLIESSWRPEQTGSISLKGYTWNFMRRYADWAAIAAIKKQNKQTRVSDGRRSYDDFQETQLFPLRIANTDQEEVVFLKQLLEKLGGLTDEETVYLRSIIDRATLSEMCGQSGKVMRWAKVLRFGSPEEVAAASREMKAFAKTA